MVIFLFTRSGRIQKRQIKKIYYGTFSLAVFLFPVIKMAEKVSGFFFSVRGEGKGENIIKKGKNIFSSFREVF